MSNFILEFLKGKEGKHLALSTGLPKLNIAIGGLQRGQSIGIAAPPKVGKTTLADFMLINSYLYCERLGTLDLWEAIYFSFEIDRVSKEFKYAAYFFMHDFGITRFTYKEKEFEVSKEYLMGRLIYDKDADPIEFVKVSDEHSAVLKEIYYARIVPIFGEYDANGVKIKKGKIEFIDTPDNPTGMRNHIIRYAAANGEHIYTPFTATDVNGRISKGKKTTGYVPTNPDKFTFIVIDHLRKIPLERGFNIKQNVDKWLEYSTEGRNLYKYTYLNIIHSNRALSNPERLKQAGQWIFPTGDDSKDTGNIAEESTIFMTLFNPNDEKYNLEKHMDVELAEYPNYRSLHITESRDTPCPTHIQLNMYGACNNFTQIYKP